MPQVVVFAFAVEDGLVPVVGAAPFSVLARQVPRVLVEQLNAGDDRGARFFPFLGRVDGVRTFLRLRRPLEPKALVALHEKQEVDLFVDGVLRQQQLEWRVLDRDGQVLLRIEVDFDPLDPLAVLPRLAYELHGQLGRAGQVATGIELSGEALGWYLILKDEMLWREAELPDASEQPLRAAGRCVELAGRDADAQQLVVEYLALLLRRGLHRQPAGRLAVMLGAQVEDAKLLDRLAGLAFAAGEASAAAAMVVRAAQRAPEDRELAERAASMAFQHGDSEGVEAVVAAARAAGSATTRLLAQLAATRDRAGDREGRAALVEELLAAAELPVPAARLVASFLLEDGRTEDAKAVLSAALERAPEDAGLRFELARCCLLLGDTAHAAVALQRALDLGLGEATAQQARRLLRQASVPGLWQGLQLVEKAVAAGQLTSALEASRALVRRVGPVAEAWLLFGVVQHKLGRLRRAERLLRRALRYDDASPESCARLGAVVLQDGRAQEAHALLTRAHELAPDDTATLLHLAQAAALCGSAEAAEQHARRAAALGAAPELVEAVLREIAA